MERHTKMNCLKLLGQRLVSKGFDRQVAKFQITLAYSIATRPLGTSVIDPAG